MYEFYNPHPQEKLVGDCVKRALTKASGKTYQEVSNELNRIKREIGASAYNSNPVWKKYVNEYIKTEKLSFPAVKGEERMNGYKFCKYYPEGTYVLRMAGHLSCCVDGVIYDTWDCQDKCVYNAWRVIPADEDILLDDVCESAPKLVPMPGIEKLEEYGKGVLGNDMIERLAKKTDSPIKKTKKGELWISLDDNSYPTVLDMLLRDTMYRELRWDTKKGSTKTIIRDEKTGMEVIFKNGKNPYVWCTINGNR